MSIKKLFEQNRKNKTVNKYLKDSSATSLDSLVVSSGQLSESIKKEKEFVPPLDYSRPENFVKYGSAKKYYEAAFDHIANNYPYDGSSLEKTQFYNDLSPLEKYVFENSYPKETGFISIGVDYGSLSDASNASNFASSSIEFVQIKGGPHYGTIYSTGSNKTSNLEFGGVSGSTVEFFLKKNKLVEVGSQSKRQVVFDLWNGNISGSNAVIAPEYGRLRIELGWPDQDRFTVTMASGGYGWVNQSVPTTGGLAICSGSWHHYAFVFNTNETTPTIDFYMDGVCHETSIIPTNTGGRIATGETNTSIGKVTGSLIANIGALRAPITGSDTDDFGNLGEGWGKLSASVDELRFWKKARTGKEIGRNWSANVDGGADVDNADFSLGAYYRFNEGTTGTSSVDTVVLDYSGRLNNGTYIGYDSTNSRQTGSAINELGLADVFENASPVVRPDNTNYKNTKNTLVNTGSQYDRYNTSYLMNTMPAWIYEQDEQGSQELVTLTQIMGSYFDTLHAQISQLNKIKDIRYMSGTLTGSSNQFPYTERLLENYGLEVPELFANATVLERFFSRDGEKNYEQSISEIKNAIYQNIYNNLSYIYKSKGTEKSIRNLLHCYGIDENIVSLNTYADNFTYDLSTNYKTKVSKKKYIDFSGLMGHATSSGASLYQYYQAGNLASVGYLTGAGGILKNFAISAELEVIFPNQKNVMTLPYSYSAPVSSSLFGWHTPSSASSQPGQWQTADDTTWACSNTNYSDRGFQIYAVKSPSSLAEITSPLSRVKDAYFVVKDRHGNEVIKTDVFQNVYDNQKWNFALTLANEAYPYAGGTAGADLGASSVKSTYTLGLYGVSYNAGIKRSSFYSTAVLDFNSGSQALMFNKRFYVGAHRENYTGSVVVPSDVRASSLRVWNHLLPTGTIDLHAQEIESFGTANPYRQAYSFQGEKIPHAFIPEIDTLALAWNFANISGSNVNGDFTITDYSSGSISGSSYLASYQQDFSDLNLRQHTGKGRFFATSSSPAVKQHIEYREKQIPEYVASSDMVSVVPTDINVFSPTIRPSSFYYSIEKSMYQSISRRMLQFFASLDEFNNLIGEPVNTYRMRYKSLEKFRELFFRRVGNTPDLEKYTKYYKWIDASVGELIQQLFPASAKHSSELRNIVESHVLERNKYRFGYMGNKEEMLSLVDDGIEATTGQSIGYVENSSSAEIIRGERKQGRSQTVSFKGFDLSNPASPQYRFLSPPLSGLQSDNYGYWKYIADVESTTLSASLGRDINSVNPSKIAIRKAVRSEFLRAKTVKISTFLDQREIDTRSYKYQSRKPNSHLNLFDLKADEFKSVEDNSDTTRRVPNQKIRKDFRVDTYTGAPGEGRLLAPFSAFHFSGSDIQSAYITSLSSSGFPNVNITNLHPDPPGGYEIGAPLQSPFTNQHVGGLKGRHANPLMHTNVANNVYRPEVHSTLIAANVGASATLIVASGLVDGSYALSDINGKTLTFTVGGVSYSATVNSSVAVASSTKNVIGVNGASDNDDIGNAIVNSINAARTGDGLPVTVSNSSDNSQPIITCAAELGASQNGLEIGGTYIASSYLGGSTSFSGGENAFIKLATLVSGTTPKGHYYRNNRAKSPINIKNIKTLTGSLNPSVTYLDGVQPGGNFSHNYEIVFGVNRDIANMDFIFNNSHYSSSAPSAFLTTPERRNLGLTGSGDYYAPREMSNRRRTKSIVASRFSAPGSKLDSKQQFRDVASNQYSPNNVLPFRNIEVRKVYHQQLRSHVQWGGFSGSSNYILNNFNPLEAISAATSLSYATPLQQLNLGVKKFGYATATVTLSSAQFANNDTFTLTTKEGLTYSATLKTATAPDASSATIIGINGLSSGGGGANDAALAAAIAQSLNAWITALSGDDAYLYSVSIDSLTVTLTRNLQGSGGDGAVFAGTFASRTGVSVTAFGGEYYESQGMPHHKTQRNTTSQFEIGANYPNHGGVSGKPDELKTYVTGAIRDNAFVTRPIPAADRTAWFVAESSGSNEYGQPPLNYSQWILSGSRYPKSIYLTTSSYEPSSGTSSQGMIGIADYTPAVWDGETLAITDTGGTTVTFTAQSSDALNTSSRNSATAYDWGVQSASNNEQIRNSLLNAIQASKTAGDLDVTATSSDEGGAFSIILVQDVVGVDGNTSFAGTVTTTSLAIFSNFAGGADPKQNNFGTALNTGSSGRLAIIWGGEPGFVPWSQIQVGQKTVGSFYRRNNLYELPPVSVEISQQAFSRKSGVFRDLQSSVVRKLSRAGNITSSFYRSFKEPPVTSKYKPMSHTFKTTTGTPESLNEDMIDMSIDYSYGNMLSGFANEDLNELISGNKRFSYGKIKRPYETVIDYRKDKVDSSTSGIEEIKSFVYSETIYPKAKYTYLSGTRQRLAFVNDTWWRNDQLTSSAKMAEMIQRSDAAAPAVYGGTSYFDQKYYAEGINRDWLRITSSFVTSQGSLTLRDEQIPSSKAPNGDKTGGPFGDGSGSIWPLDSWLYSDFAFTELTAGDGNTNHKLSGQSLTTLPAGELMMPHYGRAFINADMVLTKSGGTTSDLWTTSSLNSAQYVYTFPCLMSQSNAASVQGKDLFVTASYPGGAYHAAPAWTAGNRRRFVDGNQKGQLAPSRGAFYDSYDKWKEAIRLIGKDHTIIPEFRISFNLDEYSRSGNVTSFVSSTLELTGASLDVFDTSNPSSSFLSRYATTDKITYLDPFMQHDTVDLEVNKPPRHLSLKTDAVVSLLPYDGFYPVIRTLQMATLFSQSYGPNAFYGGESASHPARWRTLLRPFFAPGILYNSIKSGMSISYPIRRDLKGGFQEQQYGNVPTMTLGSSIGTDSSFYPLMGCLSGSVFGFTYGMNIPGNTRRRPEGNFDFSGGGITGSMLQNFFWADVVPFEGLLKPMEHIGEDKAAVITTDMNKYLRHFVSASVYNTARENDTLYRLAMSNFLGAVPEFFLKKKKYGGHMAKIVAEVPAQNNPDSTKGQAAIDESSPRKVKVNSNTAYMMEICLRKTNKFNMYNNPTAFGIPTATGSSNWINTNRAATPADIINDPIGGFGQYPSGKNWPQHRAEFAPFTPPYFYGPSICRLTYFPTTNKEVTLEEILSGDEIYTEFLNEDGAYYDYASGSYYKPDGFKVSATSSIDYPQSGWNRAWQNRMDLDASVVIDNKFPTEGGVEFSPVNKNKWVIMPKWECPVLDFPRHDQTSSLDGPGTGKYNFSSSIMLGDQRSGMNSPYSMKTKGMWHQYGVMPQDGEGVFLYVANVDKDATEFRLTNDDPNRNYSSTFTFRPVRVLKVPAFVVESKREIASLASLVGFKDEDIMPSSQFIPERAQRVGELAEDGEKVISEAIVALPYYLDSKTQEISLMTLRADPNNLGPKIKEFRRNFAHYSMPPALRKELQGLLPPNYPSIPDYINPFGDDDLDSVLSGTDLVKTPIVYLFEHKVSLSRQDLADIWQGIMPEPTERAQLSVSSIDHYMPGKNYNKDRQPVFEEILKKQLDLNIERDGIPRPDLLDTTEFPDKNGFNPEVKWIVFKLKKRAQTDYTSMILSEINGGVETRSFSSVFGYLANNLPPEQREILKNSKDQYTKALYHNEQVGIGRNTYNWPYDYFSLIEMGKLTAKVGFRPDLTEVEIGEEAQEAVKTSKKKVNDKYMDLNPMEIGKVPTTEAYMPPPPDGGTPPDEVEQGTPSAKEDINDVPPTGKQKNGGSGSNTSGGGKGGGY